MNTENLTPVEGEQPASALVWRRAHWLSPIINAWLLIAVFLFTFGREFVELIVEDGELPDVSQVPDFPDALSFLGQLGTLWLPALFLLIFAVLLLPYYIGWWFYSFAVDARNVYVRSGMLSKTERQARLDRVQSIDINRSLLARLLGLAELKFDVADGDSSALAVKFLKYKDAREVRVRLLSQVRALKEELPTAPANVSAKNPQAEIAPGSQTPNRRERLHQHLVDNLGAGITDADERQVLHVPVARLLASMALSVGTIFSVLFIVSMVALLVLQGGNFVANIAAIFGAVSLLWKRFNAGYNFRLSISPDGLKTRYGFTDTLTQTLPSGRVQAISVTQPLLWRKMGWYRVSVALAGKGEGEDAAFAGQLLPVGTYDDLLAVLPLVVPGADVGGADATTLQAGLVGTGVEGGFTVSPSRARIFDPLTYKRNGFTQLPALLLTRSGRFTRRLSIVPHSKIQSLEIEQGPLARRRALANITVQTAGGAFARVHNADAATARALFVRQAQLGVLATH
ncbi:PH domain-containing protein [Rothia sp. ZJ1223]|uniref:PH domain-containing protein n=1 Tax=Rothia sp. ZJ1223 TaxID=2811098 RepID=UPI0019562496|nr:PH domain-containing protein [Rothia sp. ZJ1223]MBM7051609.1 PH domain-containing protein [Rothia sp. ZJ1223]